MASRTLQYFMNVLYRSGVTAQRQNKMAKMALYCSPDYQTSFESVGLLSSREFNIDLQDGQDGGHLGLTIRTISATFDLHITSVLPMKFRVNWLFGLRRRIKADFQGGGRGSHLGFSIGMMLAVFCLQVDLILLSSF